jgi:Glyoxalase-like domain
MLTGIDHVLVACADPDMAAAELETAVGLRASAGGRHDAHGTFNRLVWLGDSYIELIGVFDEDLAAASWWGRHALAVLEAAGSGGERAGYMGFVLASDDLAADAALVRARGSVLGLPEEGSRNRPDGRVVRWRLSHAPTPDSDLGLLFLIEHEAAGAEWSPTERAERAAVEHPFGGPARLERVELPVTNMQAATMRVHRDAGVGFRPSLAGGGARDGAVGRQTLRLVLAAAGAVPRIVIRGGSEPREVSLLGCQWQVLPATE